MVINVKCRNCGSKTNNIGLLYKCVSTTCDSVFWDKREVKKRIKDSDQSVRDTLKEICLEALIPETQPGEFYVYVLRMRGKSGGKERVYVGETGLHPYERYLKHIAGYKAAPMAQTKKYATALKFFEGPLTTREAGKAREKQLAVELRSNGYLVGGGR